MALHEETLNSIATVLGVEGGGSKLAEMIASDDEHSLEVPKLYRESDYNTFGTNRFNEGKKAISEIYSKQMVDEYELELEDSDRKDPKKVIEAAQRKAEANIKAQYAGKKMTPDEKAEMQRELKEAREESKRIKTEYDGKINRLSINNTLHGVDVGETITGKDKLIKLFHLEYEVKKDDDGSTIVINKETGKVEKNDLHDALKPEDVFKAFAAPYIKNQGMGGGNNPGGSSNGGKKKYNFSKADDIEAARKEFTEIMDKRDIHPNSSQGQRLWIKFKKGEKI